MRLRDVAPGPSAMRRSSGPWDSKPEEAIYSYQSEFAERLLGSRPGDRLNLSEGQVEVVSIAPWKP